MKTPSIERLSEVFGNPTEAKRIFKMSRAELSAHPVGASRFAECYHPPAWHDVRMTVLNSTDNGLFGIESLRAGKEFAHYLNTGDTYAVTVIFWRGNYRVQAIGDFIDTMERRGVRFD